MKISKAIVLSLFVFLFLISYQSEAQAQGPFCGPSMGCFTDDDCTMDINQPCPSCFRCEPAPIGPGQCVPENTLCDDGSGCTDGFCNDNPIAGPIGCQYVSLAPDPMGVPGDLPLECYICEPTANNVPVDNGVCEPPVENCTNSPDCEVPGVPCNPNPDPNMFPGVCDNPLFGPVICNDGDKCTQDSCMVGAPDTCVNDPITTCSSVSDGCCPSGCIGPTPPNGCPALLGSNCDADCWFPQVCGDGLVQAPETCDDTANQGDAGISPLGQPVSDAQCRDQGAVAQCTYCGDGILQEAAGEECELGLTGTCGTGECNLSTCLCEQDLCVTGSGNPFDTIRIACANCALNEGAPTQGWFKDYRAYFFLVGLVAIGLVWRRKRSFS